MSSKLTEADPSAIAGNAPDRVKRLIANPAALLAHDRTFAQHIFARLTLTEASILPKAQEPEKLEARVVYEIDVGPGTQVAAFFSKCSAADGRRRHAQWWWNHARRMRGYARGQVRRECALRPRVASDPCALLQLFDDRSHRPDVFHEWQNGTRRVPIPEHGVPLPSSSVRFFSFIVPFT